jgi:hypothetical protein
MVGNGPIRRHVVESYRDGILFARGASAPGERFCVAARSNVPMRKRHVANRPPHRVAPPTATPPPVARWLAALQYVTMDGPARQDRSLV